MGSIIKSRQHSIAEALLSIYEAKDIMREDQRLFHQTLSDLKERAESLPEKNESSCVFCSELKDNETGPMG